MILHATIERSAACLATIALSIVLSIVIGVGQAAACACCVGPGTRGERRHALEPNGRAELDRIQFTPAAWLYFTEAFPDDIKGFAAPQTGRYAAKWSTGKTSWSLTLTGKDGQRGTLSFPLPKHFLWREAHIPPRLPAAEAEKLYDQRGSVSVYKEWHLVSKAKGDGVFAAGLARGAEARLIIQGQGNGCPAAEHFYAWTLVVKGPGASFTLIGWLGEPGDGTPK